MNFVCRSLLALFVAAMISTTSWAQEATRSDKEQTEKQPSSAERYQKLEKLLSGSKLVGQFTIVGKQQDALPKEEYTILNAKKMDKGDWWLLNARIKYGDKDVTVPLALKIKWADDTPVISLTNLTIPGLGTFSSRVVIYNNKYAGTWTHGKVGGHLFGEIKRAKSNEAK